MTRSNLLAAAALALSLAPASAGGPLVRFERKVKNTAAGRRKKKARRAAERARKRNR